MVEHPLCDRLDAEALEHPRSDLRVPLDHEPLRLAQRARLAQKLLGDRELAEVMEIAGEPRQLDRRLVGAEPPGDPRRVLADALRVAPVYASRASTVCARLSAAR